MDDKIRRLAPSDLLVMTQQIQDETGLDEVTALKIASARDPAPRDLVSLGIAADLDAALRAPPTANEPPPPPSVSSTRCPDCAGAGWYKLAVPFGHADFGRLYPCRCKELEREQHRKTRQAEILASLADELGMLADRRLATFSTAYAGGVKPSDQVAYCQMLADARAVVGAYVQDLRGWLYLWGPCGTGKSHLAAGVAHLVAAAGWRVSYASVPSQLRFLKAGFSDKTADQRMVALQVVDVLVLDDLGAEYHRDPYDYNSAVLFELINARYLANLPTIITSNMPPEDHEARIAARIRRHSRVLTLDIFEYRKSTAA